nr:MAG TPA: Sigma factor AlgU negative regulatory factor, TRANSCRIPTION.96A [Caudoviricetes sp.]
MHKISPFDCLRVLASLAECQQCQQIFARLYTYSDLGASFFFRPLNPLSVHTLYTIC